jgi:murein DD-endopeptidase MepM/ murein hydrolase activator NlpD
MAESNSRAHIRLSALIAVLAASAAVLLAGLQLASPAHGQDLQSQLDQKRAQLDQKRQRAGVLSTTIQRYNERISELQGQVATLENRVAIVNAELARKEAELRNDQRQLVIQRAKLKRSLRVLSERLVAIYKSDQPDVVSVILNAHGFDDLLTRYDYLRRIEQNDTDVAGRVRDLRDQTRSTVKRVKGERDTIAGRKAELERTQAELQSRQSALSSARADQQDALQQVKSSASNLEGDVSKLQDQIAAQIAAAQQAAAAQSSSSSAPTLPAAPVGQQSSQGFIWPVNGPVVSPFGPRIINGGYENHPGIDIAVPSGTPIRAAADGTVILEQSEAESGGYGNYTCIDHGGGISTCYAHQESFAVSTGEHVQQGQVIGYSDCTGYCFGPHLHFEVRINGQVTDPIPYLP